MKQIASKTKTMMVTVHPQSTLLTLDGTVLKQSADLVILLVTFDAKITFEKQLRSLSSFSILLFSPFLPSICWLYEVGVFGLTECSYSFPTCTADSMLIIIIIIRRDSQ